MAHAHIEILRSRMDFIRTHFRQDGVERLLKALSPEARSVIEAPDPPRGWIEFRYVTEVTTIADQLFGRGDLALAWQMGRFAATEQTGPWTGFVKRYAPPSIILRIASGVWRHKYDSGRLSARAEGKGIVISVSDFAEPHRSHCVAVAGWIHGTIAVGPRVNSRVSELRCRVRGDPTCEFRAEWDEAG